MDYPMVGGCHMGSAVPFAGSLNGAGKRTGTAGLPEHPVTEGVRSLEVRWIFAGPPETAVVGWFARFPAETESREDAYLVDPDLPGLSVKIRARGAVEVKRYHGSRGTLNVAGRACGRMEAWQKWSFPFSPLTQDSGDPPGWMTVAKRRHICRLSVGSGQIMAGASGLAGGPACAMELTEIRAGGEAWWSLGLEATGPAELLGNALQAAAALMFAQALPGGVDLGIDDSRSYAEWLRRPAGPGRGAGQ